MSKITEFFICTYVKSFPSHEGPVYYNSCVFNALVTIIEKYCLIYFLIIAHSIFKNFT